MRWLVDGEVDAATAAATWSWEHVDMVYERSLPLSLKCTVALPSWAGIARHSLYRPPEGDAPPGTLWIYDRARSCSGAHCEPNIMGDAASA